ncbi:transcription factor BIM2 isoform X2 [Silene latifolia]|uniref:transcription factor BIM2 isoform X2 n=1 Tax=Silene latifolia TaxID=37657 RepID=UPI003D77BD1C
MKSSKPNNNQEDDEDYEDDYTSKNTSIINKDAKNNDKTNVVRSKHSVTEQRRRSKINERFQMLRGLIPNGEQKRDTSSFLLEVIEYVQLLQEKVQKYEGSYQGWAAEPTKMTPWRHNHWRVQSYLGHPQSAKNGSGSASSFLGNLDDKSFNSNPSLVANLHNTVEIDSAHYAYRNLDQQPELGEKAASMPTSFHNHEPNTIQIEGDDTNASLRPASDALAVPCAIQSDDQHGEHTIEGGTISISSAYSHGLLTTLTEALQNSGVDLTEASISIQINLGKRANPSLLPGISNSKEVEVPVPRDLKIRHASDGSNREESDQSQKKLKS